MIDAKRKPKKLLLFLLISSVVVCITREMSYFIIGADEGIGPIDYFLLVFLCPTCFMLLRESPKSVIISSIIVILGIPAVSFLSFSELDQNWDLGSTLKTVISLICLFSLASAPIEIGRGSRRLLILGFSTLLLIAILRIAFISDTLTITDKRHSTAYLVAGALIVLFQFRINPVIKFSLLAVGALALIVLDVVTTFIAVVVLVFFYLGDRFKFSTLTKSLLAVTGVTFAVLSRVDLFTIRSSDYQFLGSGRIAAWSDALPVFAARSIPNQILGGGPGSAFQYWGVWWWAPKDVHSDLIRILLEYGILGTLIVVITSIQIFRILNIQSSKVSAVFISAISTSLVSNGLVGRPYGAILWLVAGILVKVNINNIEETKFDKKLLSQTIQPVTSVT